MEARHKGGAQVFGGSVFAHAQVVEIVEGSAAEEGYFFPAEVDAQVGCFFGIRGSEPERSLNIGMPRAILGSKNRLTGAEIHDSPDGIAAVHGGSRAEGDFGIFDDEGVD